MDRLWGLAAALVVALLIAAASATPIGRLLYVTPLLGSIRAHARALSLATFVLAALAAFGVQRLARRTTRDQPDRAAVVVGGLLLAVVGAILVVVNWLNGGGWPDVSQDPWYRATLGAALALPQANAWWPLLLAAASAACLVWARRGLSPIKAAALVVLIAVDLLSFAVSFNPMTDAAVFHRVPPSVEFLRRDPGLFRIAPFLATDDLAVDVAQDQVAVSWAMFYGLEDIGGFNPLQTRRYTDLLFSRDDEEASYGFLRYDLLWPTRQRLLDLLSVKYALVARDAPVMPPNDWPLVYTDTNVTIYQNPGPIDRAVFADRVLVEPNATAILDRLQQSDFDPRREAWLVDWRDATPVASLASGGAAEATVERVGANEWLIHTRTGGERFLVLSEMWFLGWHAEVVEGEGQDGQPLTVQRVNSVFQGLVVPAGDNTIRMTYRPTTVPLGIGLTALTLTACGLVWLWGGQSGSLSQRRPERGLTTTNSKPVRP